MSLVTRVINGIAIESGVEVPARSVQLRPRAKSAESVAIEQLQVGESFVVMPREGRATDREIVRLRQLAAAKRKQPEMKEHGYSVAVNPVGEGIRVWRIR